MCVVESAPNVSEISQRHDEDGDDALHGVDHGVAGTAVRLEDDVIRWNDKKIYVIKYLASCAV